VGFSRRWCDKVSGATSAGVGGISGGAFPSALASGRNIRQNTPTPLPSFDEPMFYFDRLFPYRDE